MLRGRAVELVEPASLPEDHLVEDADFAFPGLPAHVDYLISWGVFTHLPPDQTAKALTRIAARWPAPRVFLLTVFLAPEGQAGPFRQPDGVVTHPDRPPWHLTEAALTDMARAAGLTLTRQPDRLPRGQVLFRA
jgi:hypothetical protein